MNAKSYAYFMNLSVNIGLFSSTGLDKNQDILKAWGGVLAIHVYRNVRFWINCKKREGSSFQFFSFMVWKLMV